MNILVINTVDFKLNGISSKIFIVICIVIILFTSVISFGIFKYIKNMKRKNKEKSFLEERGEELILY